MNWLRKNNPFESGPEHERSGYGYAPSRSYSHDPRGRSMSNDVEVPQIFRTYSQEHYRRAEAPPQYPAYHDGYESRSPSHEEECGANPDLFRTASNHSYNFNAVTTTPVTDTARAEDVEASEEVLVRIPGAMVHLIDDKESPLLGSGDFSVIRIEQDGNGIVVFVRVGEGLQWPLTSDEEAVKLDPTHYFFTIRVPRLVDDMDKETAKSGGQSLSYGVTFSVYGHEGELRELDQLLNRYSSFSNPQLVHGDRQKEKYRGSRNGRSGRVEGMIVPEGVVSTDGKQVTEGSQAEFWTTMAPNVDDYNSSIAKGMARGTGQIIKGIFWVRDSTVARLEDGSVYAKGRMKSSSKSNQISPRTLRNLKRVRNVSVATDSVANSVLQGVVRTAGFFSGAMLKSKAGKKFFRLLPGEVALVSMDAFAKVFDAVERAGTDIMKSTSLYTQDVVTHRYGQGAGEVAENVMSTGGHVFATAWTVVKARKALNPANFKPTKTGMLKAAAKAAVGRGGK